MDPKPEFAPLPDADWYAHPPVSDVCRLLGHTLRCYAPEDDLERIGVYQHGDNPECVLVVNASDVGGWHALYEGLHDSSTDQIARGIARQIQAWAARIHFHEGLHDVYAARFRHLPPEEVLAAVAADPVAVALAWEWVTYLAPDPPDP